MRHYFDWNWNQLSKYEWGGVQKKRMKKTYFSLLEMKRSEIVGNERERKKSDKHLLQVRVECEEGKIRNGSKILKHENLLRKKM